MPSYPIALSYSFSDNAMMGNAVPGDRLQIEFDQIIGVANDLESKLSEIRSVGGGLKPGIVTEVHLASGVIADYVASATAPIQAIHDDVLLLAQSAFDSSEAAQVTAGSVAGVAATVLSAQSNTISARDVAFGHRTAANMAAGTATDAASLSSARAVDSETAANSAIRAEDLAFKWAEWTQGAVLEGPGGVDDGYYSAKWHAIDAQRIKESIEIGDWITSVRYISDSTSDAEATFYAGWNEYADRNSITRTGGTVVYWDWPGTGGNTYLYTGSQLEGPWTSVLGDWVAIGAGAPTITQFIELNDTPGSYAGADGYYLGVSGNAVTFLQLPETAWNDITGKPTQFPPTPHQHDFTADITGKPSTYPPSSHTHPWSEVTGKPTEFPPEAHTHLWADITDKPTEFKPEDHTHGLSDITDSGTMAAVDDAPSDTKQYARKDAAWVEFESGASTVIGDVHPETAENGQQWWNSDNGKGYIKYNDGDSQQWVQSNHTKTDQPTSLPIGGVCHLAFQSVPVGFLFCDGRAVSRTLFPQLFNVIGTTFGSGDGSTTFNLPDLRAQVIRGWDGGRGVDVGRVFGSEQLDAFQGHIFIEPPAVGGGRSWPLSSVADVGNLGTPTPATNQSRTSTQGVNTASILIPGDDSVNGPPRVANETRARNVALYPVIKAFGTVDDPAQVSAQAVIDTVDDHETRIAALEAALLGGS